MNSFLLFVDRQQILVFAVIKILVMFGFFLNMAPLLVFIERRQSAMIQDRIGPNRALVIVPGIVLKAVLATPALLAAAGLSFLCYVVFSPTSPTAALRGFWLSELGIGLSWIHLLILTAFFRTKTTSAANDFEKTLTTMSEPRWIFYVGLAAHGVFALVYGLSDEGGGISSKAFSYGGPALLISVLFITGGYLAYRIPSGKVGLRLIGLFHSVADAIKMVWKEDFIPPKADKLLHSMAPLIALFPALVTFAVIPFGDTLCFGDATDKFLNLARFAPSVARDGTCPGYSVSLQIADLNVGILYMFAVAGTGIIGAAIAGWSSDNKWSLLGGLRAASQMVSYEVAIGLSIVGALMVYGSPRLGDMARWQGENTWGIFVQPVAFFLFFAAAIAEHKRVPFDAPEGESEIVAGYFVEYSSFKFGMFYTGEYMEIVTSSALLITIFLGGWNFPFLHRDGLHIALGDKVFSHVALSHLTITILQIFTFFGKLTILSFGQIFIRWTLPRFRYDQIMAFGWKFLLPASLGNLVITGMGILLVQQAGPAVSGVLKVVADATQAFVIVILAVLLFRFARLLLAPVERPKFVASTSAMRVSRLGGVKSGPMQA